jgi:adenylate cyclase
MTKPKMPPKGPPEAPPRFDKDWDTAIQSVSDWLIDQVLGDSSIEVLFGGLCQRFADAGLPLWRVSVGSSTLHPMYEAMTYTWLRGEGISIASHRHGDSEQERW